MTFDDLNLNKSLHNALSELGLTIPTVIQAKSFSPIMSGKDVVGIAQTGTGKTFAFLLPALRMWKFTKSPFAQVLIVVPTRELVVQVEEEIKKLTTYLNVECVGAYGGTNMRWQKANIHAGVDFVVGTPGRLLDLMLDGVLKTKHIKQLIIDEVDEMLNLGFRVQLLNILEFLPARRQNLMFSATMTDDVEKIISAFSDYYEKIEAAPSGAPLENIAQTYYPVENFNTKANLLKLLLSEDDSMQKVLVFAGTKKLADALYERMSVIYPDQCGVMHSSKSQNNRFNTVTQFQKGEYKFIIATDIIARGLDITDITHVINFDLPDNPEKYIHRIGRTGRAERLGVAIAFVTTEDQEVHQQIEKLMDMTIDKKSLPKNLEISEELIDIEKPSEFVPFNNHKMKQPKIGGAFHEKKDKNKKVNQPRRQQSTSKKSKNRSGRSKRKR